jgi:hypothetical protein
MDMPVAVEQVALELELGFPLHLKLPTQLLLALAAVGKH